MVEYSDLFLFGDDLNAVPEALEADDNVNEYFEEAVIEVSGGIKILLLLLIYPVKISEFVVRSIDLTAEHTT